MTRRDAEADRRGLLALLTICGLPTRDAPDFLRQQLTLCAHRFGRRDTFREVYRAGSTAASASPEGRTSESAGNADFETLTVEIKAALFLLCILDFGLRDTAYIVGSDPPSLGARLDLALDRLEALGVSLKLKPSSA